MKATYFSVFLIALCVSFICENKNNKQERLLQRLKIASYNIHNAKGMDNVTDFNRIAEVINNIDAHVVAIQELDSATDRSSGVVVIDELAKRTKMHAIFGASIDFEGGKYGNGILSKEKPLSKKKYALPGEEEPRSLLVVEFKDFVFCCTHLSLTQKDRAEAISLIRQHTEKYNSKPVFLAGDLNASPESSEIKALFNSWTPLSNLTKPTYPSDKPEKTIDYILLRTNKNFNFTIVNSMVVHDSIASDHCPVWVEVEI